jgi:opacity protein-like surface antigen
MRTLAVIALAFMVAEIAAAQVPTSGNIFIGYSYYNTNLAGNRSSLNGWEGSVEGKVLPFIGIVADFDGHYGSEDFTACNGFDCVIFNTDVTHHNYLFGPRVSMSVGKFRPFAELLIGASHADAHLVGSDTSFATAVGGGLDYKFIKLLAWRFQGDYIHSNLFNSPQNNLRLSTGIVLRF